MTPTRTISRCTMLKHRGREIVLTIPPHCDYITLRQKGCRSHYDVSLAAVYDMAVRFEVIKRKLEKKGKR